MAFKVGDKIVHPSYGAGVVISIKEKQIGSHANTYYVIRMSEKRLTVMVPTDKAEALELRPVSEKAELAEMWDVLQSEPATLSNEYEKRQARIREKISSGDILQIAQAIRDLSAREQEKKLSQGDRTLMDQAEAFMASELALAKGVEPDEALRMIREALHDTETQPDSETDTTAETDAK